MIAEMGVTSVTDCYFVTVGRPDVASASFSSSATRSTRSSLRKATAPGFSDCFKRCTVLRKDAIRSSVEGVVGLCDGITCHGLSARTSVRPIQRCGPGQGKLCAGALALEARERACVPWRVNRCAQRWLAEWRASRTWAGCSLYLWSFIRGVSWLEFPRKRQGYSTLSRWVVSTVFYSCAQLGLDFENPRAKTALDFGNGITRA